MQVDKKLKADCIEWLEAQGEGPAQPIATEHFSKQQAELAEQCQPALTRAEEWLFSRGRIDEQMGLFHA